MGRIITRPEIAGGFTTAGIEIVDASGNIKAPVSTTNLTTTGTTTIGDSTSDTLVVNSKFTGQLYTNETGSAVTKLKIHNHLTTAGVGGAEYKGETINTSGTFYGEYSDWQYTPTGATGAPTDIQSGIYNTTLTAANTMTAGNIAGLTGQFQNLGTLNGASLGAGLIGSVAGNGATTNISYLAGVCSSVGSTVVNPTTGILANYIATNLGTTVVDSLMHVVGNATTTNVFTFADTTGCAAGGSVATQSGASTGSLVIKIGSDTFKIPYFT
jgi:hypothetical protein